MKAISRILLAAVASGGLALSAFGASSTSTSGGQASITLKNGDVSLCYTQDTKWSIKTSETNTTSTDTDYQIRNSDGAGNADVVIPGPNHPVVNLFDSTPDTITWNVEATRTSVGTPTIKVNGYVSVTNTGSAPATIGNIVVNLQKQKLYNKKTYWVSAAANVAGAVGGDGATVANIVAAGSQEDAAINLAAGPNNYTVSGAQGTFVETAGSGTLEFTDADSNTAFSISPQPSIAVGATVNLLFQATFDNSLLAIPAGSSLRLEVIVSFGNAGARGGGGSTANNIDVNGDGFIDNTTVLQTTVDPITHLVTATEQGANDGDEANVRSVPTRITKTLPPLNICNSKVTLTGKLFATGIGNDSFTLSGFDTNINSLGTSLGSVTVTGPSHQTFATESIDTSGDSSASLTLNRYFVGTVSSFTDDGDSIIGFGGCAELAGSGDFSSLNDPTHPILDPLGAVIGYQQFTFECCPAFDIEACAWPTAGTEPPVLHYKTYTQGGWGSKPKGNNPGTVLAANFLTVFSSGLTIGVNDAGGPRHHAIWTVLGAPKQSKTIPQVDGITLYLPAGGTAGALTQDLTNPTSTSAGVLGGQVVSVALAVGFSDANVAGFNDPAHPGVHLGDLKICATGTAADGLTIRQVLQQANYFLGGSASYTLGMTASDLTGLCDNLNVGFDEGNTSGWALVHVCLP